MNKKNIVRLLLGIGVVALLVFASSSEPKSSGIVAGNQSSPGVIQEPAEKIEVVHFHATQRCWACVAVGEYALKTIKERFPEEYENGTIVFKDVNGELFENRELVMKYRAGGSSLYINALVDGNDNIQEDVMVWRLVTNEEKFLDYFETKIKALLGKS